MDTEIRINSSYRYLVNGKSYSEYVGKYIKIVGKYAFFESEFTVGRRLKCRLSKINDILNGSRSLENKK